MASRYHVLLVLLVYFSAFLTSGAYGFVPAIATNDTTALAKDYNVTSDAESILFSKWFPAGSFRTSISYSVAGSNSSGTSAGVVVHFSEDNYNATVPGTAVPWIALVSCDVNPTVGSPNDDIFTLAHSKGAVSAILYTIYSAGCIIHPEFRALPTSEWHPIDVFTVRQQTNAKLVEALFNQLPVSGQPDSVAIIDYDPQLLNNSASDIEISVKTGYTMSAGYILTKLEGPKLNEADSDVPTNATTTTTTASITATTTTTTDAGINLTSVSVGADSNQGISVRRGGVEFSILTVLLAYVLVLHAL